MIRALIFDFDGLILETELPLVQSWQEIYSKYGLEFPLEKWLSNIGTSDEPYKPYVELERHLGPGIDLTNDYGQRHQRELELIGDRQPMPGVVQYLQEGQKMGLRIGLASSSSCKWVEGHLSRLGLIEYFAVIRAKEDVERTKPDPALFRTAVERLEVLPEEAIAFEDSPNGILAARRAGLYCVAVPNILTQQSDTSQADIVLRSLADICLRDLIAKVEKLKVNRVAP
jgi:HAD superfamily hydrolase (TIGR01509 family)